MRVDDAIRFFGGEVVERRMGGIWGRAGIGAGLGVPLPFFFPLHGGCDGDRNRRPYRNNAEADSVMVLMAD